MAINVQTSGLHHLALRSSNLEASKAFYIDTLGFNLVMEQEGLFIFAAGSAVVGVIGPNEKMPAGDTFNPHRVGLDHLALSCDSKEELERVAVALNENNIQNTGIKTDPVLGKDYVAFKDPDRISWEFYMQ